MQTNHNEKKTIKEKQNNVNVYISWEMGNHLKKILYNKNNASSYTLCSIVYSICGEYCLSRIQHEKVQQLISD